MASVMSEASEGSLVRVTDKSTEGWEKRDDGKWYKIDYYKVHHDEHKETGLEILERFFVGSFDVVKNEEWMKAKNITKLLVLGGGSGITSLHSIILRILEVNDDTLFDSLDEAVTLIKEAVAEGGSRSAILMVCMNMRTYCPVVVIAYLMAVMGWSLHTAKERVEGIFKISIAGFMKFTLERWEELLVSRKSVSVKREIVGTREVEDSNSNSNAISVNAVVAPPVQQIQQVQQVAAPMQMQQTFVAPPPQPIHIQPPPQPQQIVTVTNPIAVAPPVTYANPMFSAYTTQAAQSYVPYTAPSLYTTPAPQMQMAIEPQQFYTTAAPAVQTYQSQAPVTFQTGGYQAYTELAAPVQADWGAAYLGGGYQAYPQASYGGYSYSATAPAVDYSNHLSYGQAFSQQQPQQQQLYSYAQQPQVQQYSYAAQQPTQSYAVAATADGGHNHRRGHTQQQVVQTTTTTSNDLLRGSSNWHTGPSHVHAHHHHQPHHHQY